MEQQKPNYHHHYVRHHDRYHDRHECRSANIHLEFLNPAKSGAHTPEFDKAANDKLIAKRERLAGLNNHKWKWAVGTCCSVLLVATTLSWLRRVEVQHRLVGKPDTPLKVIPTESLNEIRKQLNVGAEATLIKILSLSDPATLAKHLVDGDAMLPSIRSRIESELPFPAYSKQVVLTPLQLNLEETMRGLCGMHYQAPPENTMSLDSPMLPVVNGMDGQQPGFSDVLASLQSSTCPKPKEALALFSTTKNGEQLLDWELFIQTWDNSLQAFIGGELGEGPLRFRVVLSTAEPVLDYGEFSDQTVVLLRDPLHSQVSARTTANAYDEISLALRSANTAPSLTAHDHKATVELKRNTRTGRIIISSLVSME